ncbi:hypothetical protein [Piscirickettsia salmonis]
MFLRGKQLLNTVKHLLQTADNWWRDFIANMDKHRDCSGLIKLDTSQ